MSLQLAIHHRQGTLSDRWVQYCAENGIMFKLVNCYRTDIVEQLRGVQGLLFNWIFNDTASHLAARQVIASAEKMEIEVFPNTATCWHYDDKIAQKYLLESIGAPLVPTYVFYDKKEAMEWIDLAEFPKVFKLKCGACSQNVRLVRTKGEARALCETAFGRGFNPLAGYFSDVRTKLRKTKNYGEFIEKLGRMPRAIRERAEKNRLLTRQKGYVYFQDFLDGNSYDTRIAVIGNRALGFTRNTRPNDFRASGSGDIVYDTSRIDMRCVKIAFEVARKVNAQSLAFDFIFDRAGNPYITEMSYCYRSSFLFKCSGHWDDQLDWHEGNIWPEDAILMDLLAAIDNKLAYSARV